MLRVEQCRGFCLWPGKRLRLELWICRSDVNRHRHPDQRVKIMPVWGWANFCREDATGRVEALGISPRTWYRTFTVPAGWPHWFQLKSRVMIFINATFDGRSAAENFA